MNFNKAEFKASYGEPNQIPAPEKPEIVFSGRSNVGKSSLINKILNRKSLARVSAVPGKTITINFYTLDNIILADLPGYGYAKVSKQEKQRWQRLTDGFFNGKRNIALVLQLIDFRHPPTKDDMTMINYLTETGIPFTAVLTKADKLNSSERRERSEALKTELPPEIKVIPFSAKTGEGADLIREEIEKAALK